MTTTNPGAATSAAPATNHHNTTGGTPVTVRDTLARLLSGDINIADTLLAEHRIEVLREAADLFDSHGQSCLDGGTMTAAEAAELLREHAGRDIQAAETSRRCPGLDGVHGNMHDWRPSPSKPGVMECGYCPATSRDNTLLPDGGAS